MSDEKHKHKMEETLTKKVMLHNADGTAVGWDIITLKKCKCGFEEAINAERHKR